MNEQKLNTPFNPTPFPINPNNKPSSTPTTNPMLSTSNEYQSIIQSINGGANASPNNLSSFPSSTTTITQSSPPATQVNGAQQHSTSSPVSRRYGYKLGNSAAPGPVTAAARSVSEEENRTDRLYSLQLKMNRFVAREFTPEHEKNVEHMKETSDIAHTLLEEIQASLTGANKDHNRDD